MPKRIGSSIFFFSSKLKGLRRSADPSCIMNHKGNSSFHEKKMMGTFEKMGKKITFLTQISKTLSLSAILFLMLSACTKKVRAKEKVRYYLPPLMTPLQLPLYKNFFGTLLRLPLKFLPLTLISIQKFIYVEVAFIVS